MASALATALGFHGTKPEVPGWLPVDVTAEQTAAIAGNQANLAGAQTLASGVNTFNLDEIRRMLEAAIPGYNQIQAKTSSNLMSQLSGELPPDVSAAVQNNAAVKALAGGYAGSGVGRNLTARDLGLTSLQITQQAMDSASRWIANTRATAVPNLFDATSMFVTPQQRIQAAFANAENKWNVDWLQAQVKAMPSAEKQGYGMMLDWVSDIGKSMTSLSLGGLGGGGMGGMGGGGSAPRTGTTWQGSGNPPTNFHP